MSAAAVRARVERDPQRVVLDVVLARVGQRQLLGGGRLKVLPHLLGDGVDVRAVPQPIFGALLDCRDRADDVALPFLALDHVHDLLEADGALHESLERNPGEARPVRLEAHVFRSELDEMVLERGLVLQVALLLTLAHFEERRLRDVEVSLFDELRVLAVEERQQESADVRAVDVGVRHDDDRVVAQLREVLLVLADAGAHRGDEHADLLRGQHLVEARLLDVQDLAAQRKDRLIATVAALLGRAARGITLDDVELGKRRVALLAIGELAR